ncbi:protein-S-isoprenylcysteine O-methyltransferase Ste14 [Bradyrhizobium sp. LA6.1]
MLQTILIMAGLGTALIGIIVIVFEWRALGGYWSLKRRPPENFTTDAK